jgi:AcrR family transcriptional regulator
MVQLLKRKLRKPKRIVGPRPKRLAKSAWVVAAREALISRGIASVRIELLAKMLGVTTGSFYWHYQDRESLLNDLLADWTNTNNAPLFEAVANAGRDPRAQMNALVDVWIEEGCYSSAYDAAIRDWARISKAVETSVRRVDDERIVLLQGIFVALGYEKQQAFIRARITYFHQVGYYAMRIKESRYTRKKLKPIYLDALM